MQYLTSEETKQNLAMREIEGISTSLPFTTNAVKVLKARYLMQDEKEKFLENPEQMFHRVASNLASTEKDSELWTTKFEKIMKSFEFIPAGRTLANAGAKTKLVSNCVVLHMEDSLDSIFDTLKEAALLQQAGSGVGFPFHKLRPAGFKCHRTLGVSSGPLSFLRIFSQSFQIIQQHGRHGANMAIMRIDHPDILEFIDAKSKDGVFPNFNFSIALTDNFLEAVTNNDTQPWLCEWNGMKMKPRYITRDPSGCVVDITEADISAPELMDMIIHHAWSNGEPGCVFIDTVNKTNPLPGLGNIECCNPCGEQFLHSGDACNLGAINLEKFINKNITTNQSVTRNLNNLSENHDETLHESCDVAKLVDFERLKSVTRTAVRLLDNVIDLTEFPVHRVDQTFKDNRRIGLGIMGLADLLFLAGLPYNSSEGRQLASIVMKTIQETAIEESMNLGREKGNFPNFKCSIWNEKDYKYMRNASLTNVAPTGSTSMLLDVSSGVEPYFALAYRRGNCLAGKMEPFVNKHLKNALLKAECYTDEIMEQILQTGTLQNVKGIPDSIKKVFVTSLDISAEDHIRMQAAIQKYCCNAISKTINFKNDATEDDVRKCFLEGWRLGCKGLTVYRNGSREFQVLETIAKKDEPVLTSITTCKDGTCDI
ncbi:Ribonucleotide reductase, all-alpha domain containing protein [Tritrichomonas foetus]|uniref:ribonucleoside-diphosphate reductase n=1 Tax=Tritrichomonas foetus TaxID=1144522 RepID=A0A1J4JW06_9EUKA|nr:Ribonucleotide reductase, all-alpha domain containing protein [Tritrichomonas foetus]|eukprot:OHT02898.1 Ribonucleotide reductase, all-alpha domain containing protein [Tritrichomonas foetus]